MVNVGNMRRARRILLIGSMVILSVSSVSASLWRRAPKKPEQAASPAAAMTLNVGEYAIHGTNNPGSIGGFVSYGCIRMHNRDVMDLYSRVTVGTPVVVLQ